MCILINYILDVIGRKIKGSMSKYNGVWIKSNINTIILNVIYVTFIRGLKVLFLRTHL